MLHIYYGMGKGKTSTLTGSLIRAKGAGLKAAYYRFLKGRPSNENKYISEIADDFKVFHHTRKFVIQMTEDEKKKNKDVVIKGLKYIEDNYSNFDVIFIDEIIDLVDDTVKMVDEKTIVEFLKKISSKDVMITGHKKYDSIFGVADLITYYGQEKHYFNKGIFAKKGIEF